MRARFDNPRTTPLAPSLHQDPPHTGTPAPSSVTPLSLWLREALAFALHPILLPFHGLSPTMNLLLFLLLLCHYAIPTTSQSDTPFASPTPSACSSASPSPSESHSPSESPSVTETQPGYLDSPSPSVTATQELIPAAEAPSFSAGPSLTSSFTYILSSSVSPSVSVTRAYVAVATSSPNPTLSPSPSGTQSQSSSPTLSRSSSGTPSNTGSASLTQSPSGSPEGSATGVGSPTPSPTFVPSPPATPSLNSTFSRSGASTRTTTPSLTLSRSPPRTLTVSTTQSRSRTVRATLTSSSTSTISATSASTPTASATVSSTSSASTTASQSSTGTTTGTDTATASSSPTPTPTLAPPTLFSASQAGPGAPLVITGQYLASQGGIDALEVQSSDGSVSFPPLSPPPCLYLPPPLTTFAIVCTLPPSIYGPSLSVRVRVRGIFTGWLVGVAATFAPRVHSVTTVVGGGGGGSGGGSTVVLYPSPSSSSFSLPLDGGTLMQVTGWGLHPVGNVSLTLSGSPPLPVPLLSGTSSSSLPFPVAAALASVAEDPLYPTLTNVSLLSTLNAALSAKYTAWVPTAMDSVLCVTPPWTSPWAGGVATVVVSLTPTQQTTNFTLVFALQPPRTRPSELVLVGASSPSSSLGLWPTMGDGLVVNPGGGGDGGVSVTGSVSVVGSGLGELGGTVLVGGGGGGYECPMLWGTTLSVLGVTRGAFEALLRVAGGDTPTSPTTSTFCPGMSSVGATLGLLSSDTVLAATAPFPLSTEVSCGSSSLICVGTQYTSTTPTLLTPLPPATTVLCITTPTLPTQQSFTPTDLGFLNNLVYNATLAPVYLTPIIGGALPLATAGPTPLTQSLTFPRHWQEAPSVAPGSSGSGIPCAVLSWLGSTTGTSSSSSSSSSSSFSSPQRGTVVFTRPPLRGSSCVALARDGNASLTSAQCLPVSYGAPAWRVGGGIGGGSLGPPLSPTSGSPLGGSVVTLAGSSLGIAPSLCAIWQASGAPGLLVGSPTCQFPPFNFTVLFLTLQQQGSTSPPAPPLSCSPILSWGDSSVTCVSPMGVPGSLANVSIVFTQAAAASAAAAVAAPATTADAITSPIPFAYSPSILLALATSPSLPVPPTGGFNFTVTGVNLLPPTPGWSAVVMLGAGVSPSTGQFIGSVGGGVSPTFDVCTPTFTPSASSSSTTSTAFTCNIPSSSSSSSPSPLSLLPTKSQQGGSSGGGTSILEGNATLSLVYYSGSRGGSGSGAGGIGSNTLPIYATPPVNVVAREVLTTGNLSGCPSGTTSPPLPCFHVSGLSPTSPLFLTITGAFLGPLVGDLRVTLTPTPLATGGQYWSPFPRVTLSPTASLPSPLPGAVNCTNPLLYSSSLITCAVVSPLPTGYLTLTIEGLAYAVIQIPALGACSPNWYVSSPTTPTTSGGGGMCAQCPSGATCPGGLSPALALPGYWATPTTSTSSAFSPCPVPQLCVGEGVCAFGTTGDFCAQCLGARVLVVGRGCVECSGGWEVSLGNVYGGALGALGGVVVCIGVWWWVERERGRGKGKKEEGGGGLSQALPLTPLLTIAVSPLHLLVILAPFLHSVQNAQGYLESTPEVDFFLRVLAFVAAAVRDLGSSTPAVLCWFKGWSQGYRVVAVAAFPLLVCAAIWVGMFVAWGVMRVVKRGEVAREEAQRQLALQQQAAALVQRFPLPPPVEEEQEQPNASSSGGGVEGGGGPVVEVEGRSSSSSTNTDNPVFGIPGTVGSLLAMFNTRVKLLESELATRDSLLQSALKAAGEAKARQMEQAKQSREVAAMARLQQAAAAATVPQTPLPPPQPLPKDLYGRWKLSVQCRLAYYCCILAFILLLPQTLAYSFAWTQCTPPSLGGYSIEDPSLSCASEGWRSWGVPLLVTPLYLLLPLACFPLLLFVGGGGGAAMATTGSTSTSTSTTTPPLPTLVAWTDGYRTSGYFLPLTRVWEIGILFRKTALAAAASGAASITLPLSRVTATAALLLLALLGHVSVRPYARATLNTLEFLGLVTSLTWTLMLLPRVQVGSGGRIVGLDACGYALFILFAGLWCGAAVDTVVFRGRGCAWLEGVMQWGGGEVGNNSSSKGGGLPPFSPSKGGGDGVVFTIEEGKGEEGGGGGDSGGGSKVSPASHSSPTFSPSSSSTSTSSPPPPTATLLSSPAHYSPLSVFGEAAFGSSGGGWRRGSGVSVRGGEVNTSNPVLEATHSALALGVPLEALGGVGGGEAGGGLAGSSNIYPWLNTSVQQHSPMRFDGVGNSGSYYPPSSPISPRSVVIRGGGMFSSPSSPSSAVAASMGPSFTHFSPKQLSMQNMVTNPMIMGLVKTWSKNGHSVGGFSPGSNGGPSPNPGIGSGGASSASGQASGRGVTMRGEKSQDPWE